MTLLLHEKAPDFSLSSTSSHLFRLSEDFKNKACIIFFYDKDFHTSCTEQTCEFRDNYRVLKKLRVEVVGISKDDIVTHIAFKNKYDLPFELLSDPNGEVSKQYQALFPLINVSKRVTYLLDKQHTVVAFYESLFSPKQHVHYMLEKLKEPQSTILPI